MKGDTKQQIHAQSFHKFDEDTPTSQSLGIRKICGLPLKDCSARLKQGKNFHFGLCEVEG